MLLLLKIIPTIETLKFVVLKMPPQEGNASGKSTFSWQIGTVYLINIMLGTGVLTLPRAFSDVGIVLGLMVLTFMALTSYCTATFVLEALSLYNRCRLNDAKNKHSSDKISNIDECVLENTDNVILEDGEMKYQKENIDKKNIQENIDVISNSIASNNESKVPAKMCKSYFTEIAEFGDLFKIFVPKIGVIAYYIVLCIWLYGALAVEFTVISKSLTSVFCGDSNSFVGNTTRICKNYEKYTVFDMYRFALTGFIIFWMPFMFFNLTTTKLLQLLTFMLRSVALFSIIILNVLKIGRGKYNSSPKLYELNELSNFVPIVMYSMICHAAIPSTLSTVKGKHRLTLSTKLTFLYVFTFSVLFCVSSIYAFENGEIQDLIILNISHPAFFLYFLQLYPVLTLSSNAPITGLILRDNLKTLFLTKPEETYHFFMRRILFPVIVIIPPVLLAYSTTNVGELVSYSGVFGGSFLLYLGPAILVMYARQHAKKNFGIGYVEKFQSPFRHRFFAISIMFLYVIMFGLAAYRKFSTI